MNLVRFCSVCLIACLVGVPATYAKQVDLRALQTPVKNQGDRDTCAYFAVSALVESAIKNLTGTEYDISEEFEIFRHKVIKPWRPEVEFGSTYDLLHGFAQSLFFYTEEYLPYQKSSPDFTKPLSPSQLSFYDLRSQKIPQVQHRSLKPKMLTQLWVKRPWSQMFKDELDQKRSVVTTLMVSVPHINDQKGTFSYNDEIAKECTARNLSCGGHAVLIVGYDDEQKVFMFKNSWGPAWGMQGYGFVTFEHVDKFSADSLTAYFDKMIDPWVRVTNP
ncbi:C1 family peptidase [Bdellovibrio sp.]|uniref:C1 family peptidase n=1 Tax=Bdellovibrio sp. TaxID=28201 RepID=UPI0039E36F80